jgi:RNA polymerase sigma-70 factor, ECF subfamily
MALRDPSLASLFDARVSDAEKAWPKGWLSRDRFVRRLEESTASEPTPAAAIAALHAADLYLACACAEKNEEAITALDRQFFPAIARGFLPFDASAAFADEVRQKLREKLFVDGKIAEYSGRGPLANWLRVTAIRTALNMRRGPRLSDESALAGISAVGLDPELDYLKARCRSEFRQAFVGALAQLSTDERNVLRMHHLDGLSLEETAAACRIGRSTAARWLAQARERILKETQRLLVAKLKLQKHEVESMFRLIDSQMDVSLHRYLAVETSKKVGRFARPPCLGVEGETTMNRTILLFPAALLALVLTSACSSKPSQATAKKGSGATTATSAKTSGQKVGTTSRQNKTRATAKGVTAGGAGKQKAGGARNALAAKTAGQKATNTSKVVADKTKAVDKGVTMPSTGGDVGCDADHELEAFCVDDTNVSFCSGGHWYALDCAAAENAFCGEDLAANTVDCYVESELVVTGEVLLCDEAADGIAYCSDDDHEVFCDQGSWYELSCSSVAPGYWCGEDTDTHVIDCDQ